MKFGVGCTYAHVHEAPRELWVWLKGVTKHKTDDFVAIVASIVDSKQNQLSFLPC